MKRIIKQIIEITFFDIIKTGSYAETLLHTLISNDLQQPSIDQHVPSFPELKEDFLTTVMPKANEPKHICCLSQN